MSYIIDPDNPSITISVRECRTFERTFSKGDLVESLEYLDAEQLKEFDLTSDWQQQPMTLEHMRNIHAALEWWLIENSYDPVLEDAYPTDYEHETIEAHYVLEKEN